MACGEGIFYFPMSLWDHNRGFRRAKAKAKVDDGMTWCSILMMETSDTNGDGASLEANETRHEAKALERVRTNSWHGCRRGCPPFRPLPQFILSEEAAG